ncbi:multicopper oxidase family protein [Pleurocapsales cyanobacterium LEGE 10410]|nr:multicopper oxidase family protein [Pleurocapsales cyanobacterium LEGE 10410]
MHLNRRKFLMLGGTFTGAVLLSQCASDSKTRSTISQSSRPQLVSNSKDVSEYIGTKKLTSKNGQLDVTLDARYGEVNLIDRQARLFNYNGLVPGPRLEVQPGDRVRLQFINNLPEATNLHYHGLHIPPTGNADNIFLNIAPGEKFTYEFTIPQDHRAGTFWYHPHLHGSTARQLFRGLAGTIVVRGELDEIPEVKSAHEEFLVIKDFSIDDDGEIVTPSNHMVQMAGREGSLLTVNGKSNPTFAIPSGGLLRWRIAIANASPSRFYRLSLENHPFYLIATDGGSLSEPVEMSQILLTPGERVDVLIRGDREPGRYRLFNLPYDRGSMGMMGDGGMMGRGRGMMGRWRNRNNNSDSTEVLATLSYDGKTQTQSLPQKLIPVETLPEPQTTKRFSMNHSMSPGRGMVFLINGNAFDPQRTDTQAQLNTVEDWEITNTGMFDHPFHLHTNYFQIISRNGQPETLNAWKDTVLVPIGETVRIRIPFRDFTGKTVYHCHILDHEDLGMMGVVEISG